MTGFARPFKLSHPDDEPGDEPIHGVQFPDGRCVLALPHGGGTWVEEFEDLALPPEAVVEWADGGDQS